MDAKTNLSGCLLILVAKRSMFGFPNFWTILWKKVRLNFHSVPSSSTLDCLSATILIAPGICATETHNWFLVQKSHILLATLLQVWDLMAPILLTKLIAVTLSHTTLTCKKSLFLQHVYISNWIAFSSKILMCSNSALYQSPLDRGHTISDTPTWKTCSSIYIDIRVRYVDMATWIVNVINPPFYLGFHLNR